MAVIGDPLTQHSPEMFASASASFFVVVFGHFSGSHLGATLGRPLEAPLSVLLYRHCTLQKYYDSVSGGCYGWSVGFLTTCSCV